MPALALACAAAVAGCPGPSKTESTVNDTSPTEPARPTRSNWGGKTAEGGVMPPSRPHFAPKAPAATFEETCNQGRRAAEKMLPALLAVEGARTLDNLLVPYNDMMIQVETSLAPAGLMRSVHPSKEVREAAERCEQEASKFVTELKLNRELYDAFASVDLAGLDPDSKRLVEHRLRDFRRAGVDKDEETRKRLKEIEEKLVELGQVFSKNLAEDVGHIDIDSSAGLAGMPPDYVAAHPPGPDGKIKITTDYPDYFPFMTYADSDELRKELYVVAKTRGEGNAEVLSKILTLRAEQAKILGYANWADYITEDKMMKSGKAASEFIERVTRTAQKRAKKDIAELLKLKRQTHKGAKVVEDWEKTRLDNKVKAQNYSFDSQAVRPYFPYAKVEAGLLDITAKIYDISYRPIGQPDVWHEDVKAFDVVRGDEILGRIYLDMHPRDGKYKHAAQFTLRSGVKGKQLPEGVLVCNFPNPRTEPPALMEHDDVVTMFHEFGHLMHHVLGGDQRWIDQSGVATEWDFVEAPSQMFEEWAWSHETLSMFAKHHETGEVIPAELVERMRKADKFGIGVTTLQQMFYAKMSLEFHRADPAKLDMLAETKRLQKKYTPFPYVPGTHFYTTFGHLEGYSALYYTYMWSLVIAKDLLTPFQEHGLMNTEWTYRYRDKILVPGGTRDAAQLVHDFLGRDFNYEAFEKYLGG